MTETLMGYKGKTGVTNEEREEYKILNQIFVNVNSDILGEVLLERFLQLGNLLPDAAIFYAPYVPLMSYVPLKSNQHMDVPLVTTYGFPHALQMTMSQSTTQ